MFSPPPPVSTANIADLQVHDTPCLYDEEMFEPFTSEQLSAFHRKVIPAGTRMRTAECQLLYNQFLADLESKGLRLHETLREQIASGTTLATTSGHEIKVTRNRFRYHIEDGLCHLVVWVIPKGSNHAPAGDDVEEVLETALHSHGASWYAFFEQTRSEQSVPEIRHLHLFLKEEDASCFVPPGDRPQRGVSLSNFVARL